MEKPYNGRPRTSGALVGGFYRDRCADTEAAAVVSTATAVTSTTLQDVHEELAALGIIASEILIHLREMTGLTPGEDQNQ